jgi:hypothetical protein
MTMATALRCSSAAPAEARRWLSAMLLPRLSDSAASREVCDDAVLCVSELVTNALRAGSTAMTLSLDVAEVDLVIAVHDDAVGRPEARRPLPGDPSGRGLLLVSSIARAWGVDPDDRGKVVWARLPVPVPARRP